MIGIDMIRNNHIEKGLKLCTHFIDKNLIDETAALNVSIQRLKTMGCGSLLQSDIVRGEN